MKAVKRIIYLVTILGIIVFLYFHREDMMRLQSVPVEKIAFLFLYSLIPLFFNAYQFKFILRIFNLDVPFKEWFGISITNSLYNYLLPLHGGLAVRGMYLKKKFRLSLSKYASLTAGSYLINFLTSGLLGVGIGLYYFFAGEVRIQGAFIGLVGVMALTVLGTVVLFTVDFSKITVPGKILTFIKEATNGIKTFKEHRKELLMIILSQLILLITGGGRLYLAFYLLDIEVDLIKVIFIQSLVVVSSLVSVLPGNIGIREGVVGFSAVFFGVSMKEALLTAVFERIIIIFLIFIIGGIFSKILLSNIRLRELEKPDKN